MGRLSPYLGAENLQSSLVWYEGYQVCPPSEEGGFKKTLVSSFNALKELVS